ncbi:MAG: hypothetical protein MI863_00430 [Desulfobacterales bacterium]|nr:hypothetical protein [Desulfobacterales bacterium]
MRPLHRLSVPVFIICMILSRGRPPRIHVSDINVRPEPGMIMEALDQLP